LQGRISANFYGRILPQSRSINTDRIGWQIRVPGRIRGKSFLLKDKQITTNVLKEIIISNDQIVVNTGFFGTSDYNKYKQVMLDSAIE
jgi:hypothetical protein